MRSRDEHIHTTLNCWIKNRSSEQSFSDFINMDKLSRKLLSVKFWAIFFFCLNAFILLIITSSKQETVIELELSALIDRKLHLTNSSQNYPAACHNFARHDSTASLSVIIFIQSDEQSVITQTVFSVLKYTRSENLHNIVIVVNDAISEQLTNFILKEFKSLPIVKYVKISHHSYRLLETLQIGIEAGGDQILYIDDTTVVTEGYQSVLQQELENNQQTIILPSRDQLMSALHLHNDTRLKLKWMLDWDMNASLYNITSPRQADPNVKHLPYETIAFDLRTFALTKKYTVKMFRMVVDGLLTTGLELGLSSWLCGGGVKIVPCSRVAHVSLQYQETWSLAKRRSIAEYFLTPRYLELFNKITNSSSPSISQLLSKHQCSKNFDWLMSQAVTHDMYIPRSDVLQYGRFKSTGMACFKHNEEGIFLQTPCSLFTEGEIVEYTDKRQLRVNNMCITSNRLNYMRLTLCNPADRTQVWMTNSKRQFFQKNKCLSHATDRWEQTYGRQVLMFVQCLQTKDVKFQDWYFKILQQH